jgi:hypothetical protein
MSDAKSNIRELSQNLEAFSKYSKVTVEQIELIAENYKNPDKFWEQLEAVCVAFIKNDSAIGILSGVKTRFAETKPPTEPTPTTGKQINNEVEKVAKKLEEMSKK